MHTPDPDHMAVGHCNLSRPLHVSPDVAALKETLLGDVLPWLAGTRGRAELAAWVGEDPERIFPPGERPKYALAFARWGHRAAAEATLHSLRKGWRFLADHPAAVEARELLGTRR